MSAAPSLYHLPRLPIHVHYREEGCTIRFSSGPNSRSLVRFISGQGRITGGCATDVRRTQRVYKCAHCGALGGILTVGALRGNENRTCDAEIGGCTTIQMLRKVKADNFMKTFHLVSATSCSDRRG